MPRKLHIEKVDGKPGEVYYPLKLSEVPKPTPGKNEILVRISAASLNHRDLFIRHHMYPAISFSAPMLADGCGTVAELGPEVTRRDVSVGSRVILTPMRGWESDPEGPETGAVVVTGSSRMTDVGTAQDYVVVGEAELELAPEHLSDAEAAALPLVGLTGWRALVGRTSAAREGANVLLTGIGGGVALQVLQLAVAMGVNAWVTSADSAKIDRAVAMGAKGGVSYREDKWEAELASMLPADRPFLDAIIDGAGGPITAKAVKLLRAGGTIAQYGMTVSPKMDWLMAANLKNISLHGSTMGSRREFGDMVAFVREKKITPVVSRIVKGLDNLEAIDGLFAEMEAGKQFGKLVIEIDGKGSSKL